MTNDVQLAWAAGLVDGEGCITIAYHPPCAKHGTINPQHILILKVAMGHQPTLERLRSIFNVGTVHKVPTKKHNPAWSWLVQSTRAYEIIKLLRPYLVTKAAEADIALKFMELPVVVGGSRTVPYSLLQKRHRLYIAMRKAKPRFRFYGDPIKQLPPRSALCVKPRGSFGSRQRAVRGPATQRRYRRP